MTGLSVYTEKLIRAAVDNGLDVSDVAVLSLISERLSRRKLPVIFDDDHLSLVSGFKKHFLYSASNGSSKFYRKFYIKKRMGGVRTISEPLPDLKDFQKWLLTSIVSKIEVSKYAHAYRHDRSIKTNAKLHVGRRIIVKMDLKNFFGSITVSEVASMFHRVGYTYPLSVLFAKLTTEGDVLPQGAPTSAAISNAVVVDMDDRIGAWCIPNGWRYTRYADDMTFSSSEESSVELLLEHIFRVCGDSNFTVNPLKTKVMRDGARKISCGVVLNHKMGPSRQALRDFRRDMYYIRLHGLASHLDRRPTDRKHVLESLIGRANHLHWLSEGRPTTAAALQSDLEYLKGLRDI